MSPAQSETEKLDEVLADYVQDGYEVLRDTRLPPPLDGFRADAVVTNGDETLVIEVKSRPLGRRSRQRLQDLAAVIDSKPGWQLVLVTLDPHPGPPESTQGQLQDWARQALDIQQISPAAATLLTASVLESALRKLWVDRIGSHGLRTRSVNEMIRHLQFDGHLSDPQAARLLAFWRNRNAIAHGFNAENDEQLDRLLIRWALSVLDGDYVSVDEMVGWFHENYVEPAEAGVPHDNEDGYIWMDRGPHNPFEVLGDHFPTSSELDVDDAAAIIIDQGALWAKRD